MEITIMVGYIYYLFGMLGALSASYLGSPLKYPLELPLVITLLFLPLIWIDQYWINQEEILTVYQCIMIMSISGIPPPFLETMLLRKVISRTLDVGVYTMVLIFGDSMATAIFAFTLIDRDSDKDIGLKVGAISLPILYYFIEKEETRRKREHIRYMNERYWK